MKSDFSFAVAYSRLLSLWDDATRRAVTRGKNAVVLTGAIEDMAVLGLMSLYRTDPIHSYAMAADLTARAVAIRFGALHQTSSDSNIDPMERLNILSALAQRDDVSAVTGRKQDLVPTPFENMHLKAFWKQIPSSVDRDALVRAAVKPLLGSVIAYESSSY